MVACRGSYVDALLAEGRRRVLQGRWGKPFVWPFRNVCDSGYSSGRVMTKARCDATIAFLLWVADSDKVTDSARAQALDMIVYQRRTQASYDLMRKYRNHRNSAVRTAARQKMDWLKKNYLKGKR